MWFVSCIKNFFVCKSEKKVGKPSSRKTGSSAILVPREQSDPVVVDVELLLQQALRAHLVEQDFVAQKCLCEPRLASSAGDAGYSESRRTEPECWLTPRSLGKQDVSPLSPHPSLSISPTFTGILSSQPPSVAVGGTILGKLLKQQLDEEDILELHSNQQPQDTDQLGSSAGASCSNLGCGQQHQDITMEQHYAAGAESPLLKLLEQQCPWPGLAVTAQAAVSCGAVSPWQLQQQHCPLLGRTALSCPGTPSPVPGRGGGIVIAQDQKNGIILCTNQNDQRYWFERRQLAP